MTAIKKQINYWRESAERNFETAKSLFRLKRYDACLFFCHLAIEKILKGLITKRSRKTPPLIHDLAKLAESTRLKLSNEQINNLRIITNFNIAGRYDNIKFNFYKQCTKPYTEKYLKISQELYLWLKEQYQKK